MSDTPPQQVAVRVPTGAGAPVLDERVLADPLDLPTGLYRVAGAAVLADGVGRGDVVRCAVSGDNQLVATEVVARSHRSTLVLSDVDAVDRRAAEVEVTALAEALNERFRGRDLHAEVSFAMCAVVFPASLDDELAAAVLERGGPDARLDPQAQRMGRYGYVLASSPDLPVPLALDGADALLAVEVDLAAPDWEGDDPVARAWDDGVRRVLQDQAATDPRLRQLLTERRYLAAIAPLLREMLLHELPADEVGPPPFPLEFGDGPDDPALAAWEAARARGGTVRWCVGDRADTALRTMITSFGLDPDADPRQPSA